jgi:carbamoyltransferase
VRKTILGISAFYHDSAAALRINGEIAAAAHEERFTRKKHDSSFPINAVRYVLQEAGVDYKDLTAVAFYDKPFLKFERLLETYHGFSPRGLVSFQSAIPVWEIITLGDSRSLRKHCQNEPGLTEGACAINGEKCVQPRHGWLRS